MNLQENKINGNKPKNGTGKVCFRCEKIVKPENNEPILSSLCLCRLVKLSGLENIYAFPYIGAGIQIEQY